MEQFTPKQMELPLENPSLVQWLAFTSDGLNILSFGIVNLTVKFYFGRE